MRQYSAFLRYSAIVLTIPTLFAQNGAWFIDTFAGTDRPINDGGPGIAALLNNPAGVVIDSTGNVLFADTDNHRVRKIAPNGAISTIAGTGDPGYAGDNGPATLAQMVSPQGLAIDIAGNLYISDYAANVVRKIGASGTITTVAGNGLPGNSGSGGKATAAALNGPYALAVDKAGNLYIAEDLNNAVRKVTPDGTIFAFTGANISPGYPEGLAIDASGSVYISSWGDNKIYKASASGSLTVFAGNGMGAFAGDGGPATAAALNGPQGIAFDAAGNLWICDSFNNRIRKIGTDGNIQSAIGSGYSGLSSFGSDPTAASVYIPVGVAIDSKGFVYWTESGNNRVRVFNPGNRQINELAGFTPALNSTAGPASLLLFNPFSTATDAAGNVYIADTSNHVIRKITAAGVSSVVAGTGNANFNGDVGTATAINLTHPEGVSVDSQGNLYIADSGNGRVRKVDTTGRITTLMGAGSGLLYPGTFAGNAFLFYPTGVVATGGGGFVMVDEIFGLVASVSPLGTISLVPTSTVNYLTLPSGVAVSGRNIYIADTYANRILKYDGSNISIIAGTGAPGYTGDGEPATKAKLFLPAGVAVDSNNNVYIADTENNAIRAIDSTGKITTIAGGGKPGFSGDKGPAISAQFAFPTGINVDASGNLEVTDKGNQRIRILKFLQTPPDLTIRTDVTSRTANHGNPVSFQISLASVGGFAGSANLSASAPGGISVQFTPAGPIGVSAGQTVTVNATAQISATTAPGAYSVVFTAAAGSVQHSATVTVNVSNLPQFTTAGVVSAASFAGGAVSPGEIVAIYGQDLGPAALALGAFDGNNLLSTQVGGTRVLFDGVAAPLIYSVAGQVSAIVPYEVAGKASTQVQIQYNGQMSPATAVNVTDAAPGIFNLPQSSQAAALNADLSVNGASNAAAAGSIVVLFATGEGQTNPGGVDGLIATATFPVPVLPVKVTIGGKTADVLYGGEAPFEVAGVLQLNVRVPADTPSGPAAVVLQAGTRVSGGSSTIAVQ